MSRLFSSIDSLLSPSSSRRNRRRTSKAQRSRKSIGAAPLEQLEDRRMLAVVSYDTVADLLNFTADGGQEDDVTITSPAADMVRIVVAGGVTITFPGATPTGFSLSADDAQLDIDTSTAPIAQFNINLGDQDDMLAFGLANAANGVANVGIQGEEGTDTVTLNALTIAGDLTVGAEAVDLSGKVESTGATTTVTVNSVSALADGDTDTDIEAHNIVLNAVEGIGTALDPLEVDATNLDVSSHSGGVYIVDTAGGLTLADVDSSGTATIDGAGQITSFGTLVIDAGLTHNADFTYATGITNGINFNSNAVVTLASTTAQLTIDAGQDVTFNGGQITATGDANTVVVNSGGAIMDGGNNDTDIGATDIILTAVAGIGTDADPLEVDATNLDVNSAGGVFIDDTAGGLTLTDLDGSSIPTTITGTGRITSANALVIATSVTHDADFTYRAGNSPSENDDLIINNDAVVTLNSSTAATLTFEAGDDIFFDSGSIKTESDEDDVVHTVVLSADLEGPGIDSDRGSVTQPVQPEIVEADTQLLTGGNPATFTTLLTELDGSPFAVGDVIEINGTNADGEQIATSTLTVAAGTLVLDLLDEIDTALTGEKGVNAPIADGVISVSTTTAGDVTPDDLALEISIQGGAASPIGIFAVTQQGRAAVTSVMTNVLNVTGAEIGTDAEIDSRAEVGLQIHVANLLNATSTNGSMVMENVGGDLSLGVLDAGDAMILLTTNGALFDGNEGAGDPNLIAVQGVDLTTSAEPDIGIGQSSPIGTDTYPIRTAIGALSATTSDGEIYVDDSNVPVMIINNVLAREDGLTPNAGGNEGDEILLFDFSASLPEGDDGDPVTLGDLPPRAAPGTYDISIAAEGAVVVGNVTAPDAVMVISGGDILDLNGAQGNILARSVDFMAEGAIGQLMDPIEASNPIELTVETFRATTMSGDISLSEGLVGTAELVHAGGPGSDVLVTSSASTLQIMDITAGDIGDRGYVTVTNGGGSLLDANGTDPNVTGEAVDLTGMSGIGTANDPIETTSSEVSATATDPTLGENSPAPIHVVETDGALNAVAAKTNGGDVNILYPTGGFALEFDPDTEELSVQSETAVTFENVGGNVNLSAIDAGSKDVNITALGQIIGTEDNSEPHIAGGKVTLISGTEPDAGVSSNSVVVGSEVFTGIGSSENPIETQVVELDASTSAGGIFISEADDLILSASSADDLIDLTESEPTILATSDIHVTTTGDLTLDLVSAVQRVTLSAGTILDGNGDTENVVADTLELNTSTGIGAGDALETSVNSVMADGGTGAVLLDNDQSLTLLSATAGDEASITVAGDLWLGTVDAPGQPVTLNARGELVDVNDTVDTGSDMILLVGHGLETDGDAVLYQNGGGSDIGGLEDGISYHVIKIDEDRIQLASSTDNANNGIAIDLTSRGAGDKHTIGGISFNPEEAIANIIASDITLVGSMIGEPESEASSLDKIDTKDAESIDATTTTGGIYISNGPDFSDLANELLALFDTDTDDAVTVGELRALASLTGLTDLQDSSLFTEDSADSEILRLDDIASTLDSLVFTRSVAVQNNGVVEVEEAAHILSDSSLAASADGDGDGAIEPLPDLTLTAMASGRGADIDIDTAGNIVLETAIAEGDRVTLRAGGSITDGNQPAPDDLDPQVNIKARTLDIAAPQGIGHPDNELEVEVNVVVKADGGVFGTFLFNVGSLALTESALEASGNGELKFEAGSITILDIGDDVALNEDGRDIILRTRAGNIVFLDPNDTIQTDGTITIEARSFADDDAVAVLGNLQTAGADITVSADRTITIGLLNAGTGNVTVQSDTGIIVDGNGSDVNVIAGSTTLSGNAPTAREAELVEEFKIAEAAAASAEAEAKLTSADSFGSGSAIVSAAEDNAKAALEAAEQAAIIAANETAAAESVVIGLEATSKVLDAVSLALGLIDMITDDAGKILNDVPLIGGAGTGAVGAIASGLAFVADTAALAVNSSLTAANFDFGTKAGTQNQKDAEETAARENLALATATRQAFDESFSITEAAADKAVIVSAAAAQVRDQAIAARDQANVIGTFAEPLGLEVTGVVNVIAGPTDSFLQVTGPTAVELIDTTGNVTPGSVTLISTGAITDTDDPLPADEPDILALGLTTIAVGGIGTAADPLETRLAFLNATNSSTGDIAIANTAGAPAALDITGISNEGGGDVIISSAGSTAAGQGITVSGPISAAGAGATVTIHSLSPLTIDSDISSADAILLEASETLGAGDDLTVNSGVTIESTGSSVTLRAGDNITVSSGSTIQASTDITITADFNDDAADTTGASVMVAGTLIAPSASIGVDATADDNDTFTITPSATTPITVDAEDGMEDTLNFTADGLPVTILGNQITAEGRQPVTFDNFEFVNITNADGGGSVTLLTAPGATDDMILMGTGQGAGTFTLNGGIPISFSDVTSFTFNAGDMDDTATVTPFATSVLPWNVAVSIDGGADTDRISYNNVAGLFDSTRVTATAPGAGHIDSPGVTSALNSQLVSFTNVEDITANANPGEDEKLTVNHRDTSAADTAILLNDDVELIGLFNVDTENYVGLTINGNGGDDTFEISPGSIPVFVDGGDPIGSTAGDAILFKPTDVFTLESGPENDAGGFVETGKQRVSFDHIEEFSVSGGGAGVFLGTNGDDDITIVARDDSTHAEAGADGVQDFTVSLNSGPSILLLDLPMFFIDALAGDDDIVLRTPAPNDAVWDVDLFIAGGPPAAPTGVGQQGDVFALETPGTQTVTYSPTGIDTATIDIETLSSVITIAPFIDPVNGLPSSPRGVEQIVYRGLLDDTLTMNGTDGEDNFVVNPANGGSGGHRSQLAPTFDYTGANALAVDGASGFDTILIKGTPDNDTVFVDQDSATDVTVQVNGVDVAATAVEHAQVEARQGDDTIGVRVAHELNSNPASSLRVTVHGSEPNASDRLMVVDDGIGNTVQHHQGTDERSGSVIVGALSPVSYEGVEFVDIAPLDTNSSSGTFGGTGSDGLGRIVVFHPDTFSHNNSFLNPTELPDIAQHTAKPTINPGAQTDQFGLGLDLNGDEDWYRFIAPKTSTFQFQALFDAVPTLANGQPGLPGDGLLRVDMFHADGTPIVRLPSETVDAIQTIGTEKDESYLLRVRGAIPESINIYDVSVVDKDLLGPQIVDPDGAGPDQAIQITGNPTYNIFDVKPVSQGPTPLIDSLTVNIQDLPNRFPGFVYEALDPAISSAIGHYTLIGDHNGIIPISDVIVTNAAVVEGGLATATIEVQFDFSLPDDRYTLTLSDSIVDPGGNKLDGESNAQEPQGGATLPSGDTVAGADFVARFTVDSRPEVATYLGDGTWYVDLNGNGVFDPDNTDFTHRDIVWKFGTKGDLPVVGDWNGDGYDEIGVIGDRNGQAVIFLDLDRNGAFQPGVDASFDWLDGGNGSPIAGDWDGDGDDELALLANSGWFVDLTGANYDASLASIDPTKFSLSTVGLPVAADWDGDGIDNLGFFVADQFHLSLNNNLTDGDDLNNADVLVNFPEFDFGGLDPQPIAHDFDQDGDGDIGLFVRRETGNTAGDREAGEWFLDVNTDLASAGTVIAEFEPPLTGQPGVPFVNQDIFINFGDEREPSSLGGLIPIVGNFDPPVSASKDRDIAAGDANRDFQFDQLDIVQVLQAARYLTALEATFAEGDWNGDGLFDQLDIVEALQTGNYLQGLYASHGSGSSGRLRNDAQAQSKLEEVDHVFRNI